MASSDATKVMILGVDAPIVPRVLKYVDEGVMPELKRLIDRGVLARNCLVPYPTITPPNWTTIVTGAWAGTHGITCFHVHNPGDPLDEVHAGFDSADNQAEFLWEALARDEKRSIVLNYPTTWPPRMSDLGIQVAGAGLAPNEWRHHFEAEQMWDVRNDVSNSQLFATDEYPRAQVVTVQPSSGWECAPPGSDLEVELPLVGRNCLSPLKPETWWGLVLSDDQGRCDRMLITDSKHAGDPMCELKVGEWSAPIVRTFETEAGPRRTVFKLKLLELSRSGRELKLFLSPLCALDGYHHPPEIAAELEQHVPDMPLPVFGIEELNLEWIDDDTWREIMRENHQWMAHVAEHLLESKQWDLYAMHLHCPDWAYHAMATRLDPLTEPDEAVRARFEKLEREFHRAWDDMLGTIVACADENTVIAIVSDHGAQATTGHVPIRKIMRDAGLLELKQDEQGNDVIDWSQTKAAPQRSCYIYVNLKGRDPEGIVAPGEEYEQVRERAIAALMDYTDPETGLKPFTLALRSEDARVLGLYGARIGDVVFAQRAEFCGQHGPILPTAKIGIGSVEGLLVLAGPGVKQGEVLERNAWLVDVVPTVCHLAEWPMPAQAEGAILYQALSDPDAKTTELRQTRRNYDRLKRADGTDEALTHRYNM